MNRIKTYRLLAIVVLLSSCNERIIVGDLDSLGLRYRVKSMSESFYIADNCFDSLVLRKKLYLYKYTFRHDSKYKSVEKTLFLNNSVSLDSVKKSFPHLFKEPEYCFVNYNYISDSLTILEISDTQGNLISRINRKYAGNRLLSEEKYSGSGNLVSKSDFRYDSRNKLLNRTVFYQNEYQETNYAYRAGEKFESDNEFNYRYKFNINGRISNKKTYKGISFTSETHFYYNDYGNVITVREIDKDGTVKRTLYDYIYDSNNNWTLCVEYDSADNIFVHKREIIYYN